MKRGYVHMKSCKQMAEVWGISERRVTEFCKEGMIPGAVKVGKRWQIPDDAKRPADKRIVTGRYIKSGVENEKNTSGRNIGLYPCTVRILLCGQNSSDQRVS